MSYNIHWGIGMDDNRELRRIADVIDRYDPDIIGVQEVDRNRRPETAYEDQLAILQAELETNATYGVTIEKEPTAKSDGNPRQYGIATLTPYEIIESTNHHLTRFEGAEQRTLLETAVEIDGVTVPFFNTHLGLTVDERVQQASDILEITAEYENHVLVGDFNAVPESQPIRTVTDRYTDVLESTGECERATFPSPYVDTDPGGTYTDSYNAVYTPDRRIDYVFVTPDIEPRNGEVVHSLASDHSPVVADIRFSTATK